MDKLMTFVSDVVGKFGNRARLEGYLQGQHDYMIQIAEAKRKTFELTHKIGNVFIAITPSEFDVVVIEGHHSNGEICFTKSLITGIQAINFAKLIKYSDSLIDAMAKLSQDERFMIATGVYTVRTEYSKKFDAIDPEAIKAAVAEYTKNR